LYRYAEAILDALGPLSASGGARGRGAQRAVQRCLILGHTRDLVDNLLKWVFPGAELAAASPGPGAEAGATPGGGGGGGVAGKPPPGLLRFAAHLLLFLQALLPDGGGLQVGLLALPGVRLVTCIILVHHTGCHHRCFTAK
jgi:hypothetical protein